MRTKLLLLISCFAGISAFGQMDTSVMLISKIDFQPQYELHDGTLVELMGYSKTLGGALVLPSPTLEFEEGDSVNLSFWNLSQGPPHTIHLHGLDVDQQNDGVPMLSFDVSHDDTGSYFFKASHPGTYIYHCHVTSVLHVQAGMYGLLIVRPKNNPNQTWNGGYDFDSEKAWMLSELDTNWHHDSIINHDHDPMATTHPILPYKPQHFLVNGKSESQLQLMPYTASVGEVVFLRLANIGYYGNRVTFPAGLNAVVVSSDGRPLPSQIYTDNLEIYPGERYGILVEAVSEFNSTIEVDYINLNTQEVENTQSVEVNIEGFIGLDELSDDSYLFPNPSNDIVRTQMNGDWQVFDISGKQLKTIRSTQNELNVQHLQSGMYILVSPQNQTYKLQILKQ